MNLHAPDKMGAAAHAASRFASSLAVSLMTAKSSTPTREQRAAELVLAFQNWRKLCSLMAELERTAPNAAAEGYAKAEDLAEFAERVNASSDATHTGRQP